MGDRHGVAFKASQVETFAAGHGRALGDGKAA